MGEFHRIYTYFAPLSGQGAYTLRDDTATLPPCDTPYVLSTDTIISGTHFIGNESPDTLAQKLLAVNLSDLASVGAVPVCYSLNISLPKNMPDTWFKQFCQGLSYMNKVYNIYVIGGDTTHFPSTNAPVVLSATVYGKNAYPTHRNKAQIGDMVCITGATGRGFIGLQIALNKVSVDADIDNKMLSYYQTPTPHISTGQKLAPYINACCDVSDGLVADLQHIAMASNVHITLNMPHIPICHMVNTYAPYTDIQHAVLAGGDDYVLACTIPEKNLKLAKKHTPNLHVIGRVSKATDSPNVCVLNDKQQDITPKNKGFIHN